MDHHGISSSSGGLPVQEVILEVGDFLVARAHSVHSVPLIITDGSKFGLEIVSCQGNVEGLVFSLHHTLLQVAVDSGRTPRFDH